MSVRHEGIIRPNRLVVAEANMADFNSECQVADRYQSCAAKPVSRLTADCCDLYNKVPAIHECYVPNQVAKIRTLNLSGFFTVSIRQEMPVIVRLFYDNYRCSAFALSVLFTNCSPTDFLLRSHS